MLLGTDELTILRGSKFYGTWQWVNSVTGDPEDFAGLSATIKIKNIHEDFEDIKNTYEVGTAIVEPLDIEGNAFKGRVDISLSKEDTLLFAIPEDEDDRYGESDFYAILEILLSTGEVILQAKVKVIESIESEGLDFFIDEREEAIIIKGKLDNILLRHDEYISTRDNLIDVVIPAISQDKSDIESMKQNVQDNKDSAEAIKLAIETIFDNFDDRFLGQFDEDPLLDNDGEALKIGAIYYNNIAKELRFYNSVTWDSPVAAAQTYAQQASQSASNANTSKLSAKQSEDNAKASEEIAIQKANQILNLEVQIETLSNSQTATINYNTESGILSLGIPQGLKGDAFTYEDFTPEQLLLLKGQDGTLTFTDLTPEQIASLQGLKGDIGLSAYEIAVNNGFVGTEQEWLESLNANLTESNIPSLPISKIIDLETTLNSKINVADIIDDLNSTLVNKPLSANQGKVLKELFDNMNTLLSSDDTTLDELQEIVNYIKQNKTDLQNLDLSNIAETATLKHFTQTLLTKLSGIAENANNYSHPSTHDASMITESTTKRFVSDTEKTTWNGKLDKSGGTLTGAITAIKETKIALSTNNIDLATGNLFTKTITTATTFTVSNIGASGITNSFILELTNGGSAVITWWSGVKWAGGTAPVLTSAGVDILGFYSHDGGTTWRGMIMAKDSK